MNGQSSEMASVANNTKWQELRTAMLQLESPPAFRMMDLNGHYTPADKEWFYHFSDGGYRTMQWVDLIIDNVHQGHLVRMALQDIGLAGHATDDGFRAFGYVPSGQPIEYFREQK